MRRYSRNSSSAMLSLPSSSSPKEHDVFLSFRGEDTRTKFTDHLDTALRRSGIKTFKDELGLEAGEAIAPKLFKAIQESWCSVIVFSENYASSGWCLDELAEIVKQRNQGTGHNIFPIFYDVDPSDLRRQRGKVAEAFAEHEERSKGNTDKIESWRSALTQVANLKGWHLNDRHESEFIGGIVREISAKLLQVPLNNLKRKLEELNGIKEDNESRKSTELKPGKKLKMAVEIWFQNVDRINGEILDLENKVGETNAVSLSGGSLRAEVLKRTEEVEELIGKGKSFNGLAIDEPQWIGQVLSTTTLFGELPSKVMEEIWAYLMDDAVSKIIGVWGMGGVGKTTIMKLINNQLLKETEKFDIVIWVTVSKEMNIARLQDGIARALKKESHCLSQENDETRRAGMLYDKLTQAGKYVLILDDVWDTFSLEEVGIPEPSSGSKIVITTRSLEVCQYFGAQKVKLHALSKQDAGNLFLKKVGDDVLHRPDLLPIVKSVAEECDGLPLAIVTIASSMKGARTMHEWRNALNELRRCGKSVSGSNEKLLQQLQLSYDRLEDEKFKYCFLYLALYPEDENVLKDILIENWIDEGFVEEMDSSQAEIDRGHTIMNKLINNCLFETSENWEGSSCVKLHDLMRDMALRITSTRPRFLVKAGMQLKLIPGVQEWTQDLEKVSFQDNWPLGIPLNMSPPKCGMLTTLLLGGCWIKSIPESFFEHMHGLKVLDLSDNRIVSLPASMAHLKDLIVLLLNYCGDLKRVPSVSNLQALKKLNLAWTGIEDLPHGMERLANLQHLDLSYTRVNVPDGLLAKFTSLRSLKILGDKIIMKGEEIGGWNKLEQFEGMFSDLDELNDYLQAVCARTNTLFEYRISVGSPLTEAVWFSRRIELDGGRIPRDGQAIKILSDVEALIIFNWTADLLNEEKPFFSSSRFIPMPHASFSFLSQIEVIDCRKIKKLFPFNWVKQNLQNLVKLWVWGCAELEEIIASDSESDHVEEGGTGTIVKFTLPKLKTLSLRYLPRLKSICRANRVMVCDSIEEIPIIDCPELKRMPLYLPLGDDGQPSPPPTLQRIYTRAITSEMMEWVHHPNAKSVLQPFLPWR